MKKAVILSLFGCLLFMHSACKKEKNPSEPIIQKIVVNESLKSDFYFQPGSYWLYSKDSLGLPTDCTFVAKAEMSTSSEDPNTPNTRYVYGTVSLGGKPFQSNTTPSFYVLAENELGFGAGFGVDRNPLFSYVNSDIAGDSCVKYPVYTIDSIQYKDVYRVKFGAHSAYPSSVSKGSVFYACKGIGFVRKDLPDGKGGFQSFFLKKYHVVK
jgi:hypothetical protein